MSVDDERYNFNKFKDLKVVKDESNGAGFLSGPLTKLNLNRTKRDLTIGNITLPDISISTVLPPIVLIFAWLVATIVASNMSKSVFGTVPLLYGHALLNGGEPGVKMFTAIWNWTMTHGFIGRLGLMIFFTLILLTSCLSAIISIFVHASLGHALFNGLLLILLCAAAYVLGYKPVATVYRWLSFGYIATLLSYGLVECVAGVLRLLKQSNLHPELTTWYTILWHANIPFVGASVGLMAVLGCLLTMTIKYVLHGDYHWVLLIILSALTLVYLVTYVGKLMSPIKDVSTDILVVSAFMHLFGLFFGMLRGFLGGFR